MDGSAALDRLNDAAVTGPCRVPHDAVASLADAGTAGIYRLAAGDPLPNAEVVSWFAKPEGWSYEQLYERVRPPAAAGLWVRHLVLGPTPEEALTLALAPLGDFLELSLAS